MEKNCHWPVMAACGPLHPPPAEMPASVRSLNMPDAADDPQPSLANIRTGHSLRKLKPCCHSDVTGSTEKSTTFGSTWKFSANCVRASAATLPSAKTLARI